MAVVLAAYAQLLNNVVDKVFDWADKGPSACVGDLNQLLESLTRRQLGDRWEEIYFEFQHQGADGYGTGRAARTGIGGLPLSRPTQRLRPLKKGSNQTHSGQRAPATARPCIAGPS